MYSLFVAPEAKPRASLQFLTIVDTSENAMPFGFAEAKLPFLLITDSQAKIVCASSFANCNEAINYAEKVYNLLGNMI